MAWTPVLVLLSHCTGRDRFPSQPVVTQPPSFSASLGTTARLTCTLSRDISVGSYYMYWFQQRPGSPPRYLLYYYSDSDKPSGTPARVSGSDAGNTASLTVLGLQPEDKTEYYHSTWDDSINNDTVLQAHGDLRHNLPLFPRATPMNACDKQTGRPWRV
uniref:Ig-like domain-containing protein n=1 Tax=Ursus maritimus TaxID=29073 RepID=A0A452TR48_URSMA